MESKNSRIEVIPHLTNLIVHQLAGVVSYAKDMKGELDLLINLVEEKGLTVSYYGLRSRLDDKLSFIRDHLLRAEIYIHTVRLLKDEVNEDGDIPCEACDGGDDCRREKG